MARLGKSFSFIDEPTLLRQTLAESPREKEMLPRGASRIPRGPSGLPRGVSTIPRGPSGLPRGVTGLPRGPSALPHGLMPPMTEPASIQTEEPADPDEGSWELVDQPPPQKKYWMMKLQYFMNGAGASFWGRFDTLWFEHYGLDAGRIGFLNSCIPFVSSMSSPLWGYIVDRWGHRREVMCICTLFATLTLQALNLTGRWIESYAYVFGLMAIYAFFAGSYSLFDSTILDMLGNDGRLYGKQRLWAAISWGSFSGLAGFVLNEWGWDGTFVVYGFLQALTIILIYLYIPNKEVKPRVVEKAKVEDTSFWYLIRYISTRRNIIFFLVVLTCGIGLEYVEDFLFLFLTTELDASSLLCGVSVSVTVLFELPVFHSSTYLLKKIGIPGMLTVAMIAHIIRVMGYTFLTKSTVWWVLALEPMHGVTFACMWAAAVHHAALIAPKGLEASTQGLLSGVYSGLGFGLGGLSGGQIYQYLGPVILYYISAGMMGVVMSVYLLSVWLFPPEQEKGKEVSSEEGSGLTEKMLPASDEDMDYDYRPLEEGGKGKSINK